MKNDNDSLAQTVDVSERGRMEGRKEVFRLAMKHFGENDGACHTCGGIAYEGFFSDCKRMGFV